MLLLRKLWLLLLAIHDVLHLRIVAAHLMLSHGLLLLLHLWVVAHLLHWRLTHRSSHWLWLVAHLLLHAISTHSHAHRWCTHLLLILSYSLSVHVNRSLSNILCHHTVPHHRLLLHAHHRLLHPHHWLLHSHHWLLHAHYRLLWSSHKWCTMMAHHLIRLRLINTRKPHSGEKLVANFLAHLRAKVEFNENCPCTLPFMEYFYTLLLHLS